MESSVIERGWDELRRISTPPPDIAREQKNPNTHNLNLNYPFHVNNLRFWLPVGDQISLANHSGLCLVINKLSYDTNLYPDIYIVPTKRKRVTTDYYLRVRKINFWLEVGIIIIPRLVQTTNAGRAVRYYLEVHYHNPDVNVGIKHQPTNTAHCEWILTYTAVNDVE